jgi:hypothetical protein
MVNRAQPFRHHDVKRAFRAAVAAGVHNPSVEVRLPTGTTITICGDDKPGARVSTVPATKTNKPTRSRTVR